MFACRLSRNVFVRNRRPSVGGFCINSLNYFLPETMIATRTPKAIIKDILNREYTELLSNENETASAKFLKLEKQIREDRRSPGVIN